MTAVATTAALNSRPEQVAAVEKVSILLRLLYHINEQTNSALKNDVLGGKSASGAEVEPFERLLHLLTTNCQEHEFGHTSIDRACLKRALTSFLVCSK